MNGSAGFKGELSIKVIRGAGTSLWRKLLDLFLRRTIK